MATRTVDSEIIALLSPGNNYRRGANLFIFRTMAWRIINRVVDCAAASGVTIDAGTLKDMETAIAAHLYTRSDPTYKSRSTLSASGSMNTDGSEFLNIALMLDPSGCLANIMQSMKSQFAGGAWLGKKPSEKTSYRDWDPGAIGL